MRPGYRSEPQVTATWHHARHNTQHGRLARRFPMATSLADNRSVPPSPTPPLACPSLPQPRISLQWPQSPAHYHQGTGQSEDQVAFRTEHPGGSKRAGGGSPARTFTFKEKRGAECKGYSRDECASPPCLPSGWGSPQTSRQNSHSGGEGQGGGVCLPQPAESGIRSPVREGPTSSHSTRRKAATL